MALPSSGAISLADVNTNIGVSSTAPITMNDSPVRWLANGSTAAGPVSMNNLRGKSWSWATNVSQAGFTVFGATASATDSSGYVYSTAFSNSTGMYIIKTNPVGGVVWITRLSPIAGYSQLTPSTFRNGLAVSSAGNVYLSLGYRTSTSPFGYYYGAAKLNSSGVLQWSSFLVAPSAFSECGALAIDSSENVYVNAFQDATFTAGTVVAKFNSSGALQWQKNANGLFVGQSQGAVNVDTVNNFVYLTGLTNTGAFLGKFDTNLSLQWGANLYSAVGATFASAGINTSNQNVYVALASGTLGVVKYNSSGTLQWQKYFSTGSTYMTIAADASDNAYVHMDQTGGTNPYIVKVNSSGSIAGQVQFTPNGMSFATYNNMGGVAVTGNSVVTVMNTTTSSAPVNGGSIIKIPNSLSTTGTYGRVIMSTPSITVSNASLTPSSVSLTVSTSSFSTTSSLVTGSDVTGSFTKTVSPV